MTAVKNSLKKKKLWLTHITVMAAFNKEFNINSRFYRVKFCKIIRLRILISGVLISISARRLCKLTNTGYKDEENKN